MVPPKVRAGIDAEFYRAQVPGLTSDDDAARHYHDIGWREGLDPSPRFSTKYYLENNADVVAASLNPLFHYLGWGEQEGRLPHRDAPNWRYFVPVSERTPGYNAIAEVFDTAYYAKQWPALRTNQADPVAHYIRFGWRQGLNPSPDFSTRYYLTHHPELATETTPPLLQYLETGIAAGSLPMAVDPVCTDLDPKHRVSREIALINEHFDPDYYRRLYGSVLDPGMDPVEHYVTEGAALGLNPGPDFDTAFYTETYPDAARYGISPLTHFVIWGRAAGLRPSGRAPASSAQIAWPLPESAVPSALIKGFDGAPEGRVSPRSEFNPSALDLHWVIPDFGIGGGGHMTIFRMIEWLEFFGHRCTIWLKSDTDTTPTALHERILKHYRFIKADCRILDETFSTSQGDGVFATSWETARVVAAASGFKARYYFVQDYEPEFYPRGSLSLAAQGTYDLPLACICASSWLKDRMEQDHGRWARAFELSFEPEVYSPPATRPRNAIPRIAFYGRTATARRCVELGWMAADELTKRGVAVQIDLFGADTPAPRSGAAVVDHGILDPPALARLFQSCDLGLCFSATNYSLIPQEMMATGLPVVDLSVDSTEAIFPEGVVLRARPDPRAIADVIENALSDRAVLQAQAKAGRDWVTQTSWEHSARQVETHILDYLSEAGWSAPPLAAPAVHAPVSVKASIIVPTLNGGSRWRKVAHRLATQRAPWELEVLVIDSGSYDDTIETAQGIAHTTRVIQIDKAAFQHGRTRNLGAAEARGEFLLYLTQDAMPTDPFWAHKFVSTMEMYPEAQGGFGRHIAYPEHSPFVRSEIERHFASFSAYPLLTTKFTDLAGWNAKDPGVRRALHFYSDNNSCMRRSAWDRHPYPEVDYGEDQLWAYENAARGGAKVYAPNAVVYHSHDYTPDGIYDRSRTEALFFAEHFGYDLTVSDEARAVRDNLKWLVKHARQIMATPEDIATEQSLFVARLKGWRDGSAIARAKQRDTRRR